MIFVPNFKLWIESKGQKVFGDGPCDILQRIKRTGSLRTAAMEIKMSYSQAWRLINTLERKLGFPLLVKKAGGAYGGGSKLTVQGEELVRCFASYRQEAESSLQSLFKKNFNSWKDSR